MLRHSGWKNITDTQQKTILEVSWMVYSFTLWPPFRLSGRVQGFFHPADKRETQNSLKSCPELEEKPSLWSSPCGPLGWGPNPSEHPSALTGAERYIAIMSSTPAAADRFVATCLRNPWQHDTRVFICRKGSEGEVVAVSFASRTTL